MENAKTIKVRVTFTDEVLGGSPASREVYEEYIASKSPNPEQAMEEVEMVSDEKGKTVFLRDKDGNPCMLDYQVKGFFKDATGMLRRIPGTKCSKVKNYKKEIDGLLFVFPREIQFHGDGEIGECIRSLRADTMQGPRVTLANSETLGAGTYIEFEVMCLTEQIEALVRECLNYGRLRGMLQWRNSGKGRFTWEEL